MGRRDAPCALPGVPCVSTHLPCLRSVRCKVLVTCSDSGELGGSGDRASDRSRNDPWCTPRWGSGPRCGEAGAGARHGPERASPLETQAQVLCKRTVMGQLRIYDWEGRENLAHRPRRVPRTLETGGEPRGRGHGPAPSSLFSVRSHWKLPEWKSLSRAIPRLDFREHCLLAQDLPFPWGAGRPHSADRCSVLFTGN